MPLHKEVFFTEKGKDGFNKLIKLSIKFKIYVVAPIHLASMANFTVLVSPSTWKFSRIPYIHGA